MAYSHARGVTDAAGRRTKRKTQCLTENRGSSKKGPARTIVFILFYFIFFFWEIEQKQSALGR